MTKKQVRRWVRSSFTESKDLPHFTSLILIPGNLQLNHQLSYHMRRTRGLPFGILHVKSFPWCRDFLLEIEKLILAIVVSLRKLQPYYQAHLIIVITDFPLRSIHHSPEASQRLMKWAIELSQYDFLYRLKTIIKVQALAVVVLEFTSSAEEEKLVNENNGSSRADKTSFIEPGLLVTCASCA